MRHIAISAAVLIAAAGLCGQAAAQDRPAAYANAEACLIQNVDAAVAASSGATDAVEFLLTYLCAGPVGAASKYEVNSELLASGKGLAEGFLTMMPAETAMDMPDFENMSEDEIDAWLDGQETEAEAAAAAAGAAAPSIASDGSTDFAVDETGGLTPVVPTDPFEGITVDPVTGEIVAGENPMGPVVVTLLDYMEATGRMMSATPPVFLREMAARLVVERRRR